MLSRDNGGHDKDREDHFVTLKEKKKALLMSKLTSPLNLHFRGKTAIRVYLPHIVSASSTMESSRYPTPKPSSLRFCADVQFPRDSIRAFNDRIKKHEKIES